MDAVVPFFEILLIIILLSRSSSRSFCFVHSSPIIYDMVVDELPEPEREQAEVSEPECECPYGNELKPECKHTDGTELEPKPSETEGADDTAPSLEHKWLLHKKKRIGRLKDGRKVNHGTYDYQGAHKSLCQARSVRPLACLGYCVQRYGTILLF